MIKLAGTTYGVSEVEYERLIKIPLVPADTTRQRRILVVEDDYIVAKDIASKIEAKGEIALGPVPSVERALNVITNAGAIDGALLDIKLGHEDCYPVADALEARGIPYVFLTGYERSIVPPRYREIGFFQKPIDTEAIRELVECRF